MAKAFTEFTAAGSVGTADVVLISQRSSAVTITATTLSAAASDNSFNDSGGGFVTAGFAVGDRVAVSGFTGNVANNIYSAKITALTAGKMTIGGTDGDVIVDDAAGESVTISKWETKRATAQDIADLAAGAGNPTESLVIACSDETTALTTGTAKVTFRMPYAFTLSAVRASLSTAQTSGSVLTVDINEAGSTVLSTKLIFDNTQKSTGSAAQSGITITTVAVISDSALADNAEMTIDIDQIGDGTAKGLKCYLIGSRT